MSETCNKVILNGETIIDLSQDTVTDALVMYGTTAHNGRGEAITGTYSPRIYTNVFTATTSGEYKITVPLKGSGYPIMVIITPYEGPYYSSGTFYSLVDIYAINTFVGVKIAPDVEPTYSSTTANNNNMTVLCLYKSNASTATTHTVYRSMSSNVLRQVAPTASRNLPVRFYSATDMRVYIASDSYGFAPNITYKYSVIYRITS